MNAYVTTGWENFFVAEAGAAAALAGLLFVAVSINLARILSFRGLSGRAAEALFVLFGVLAVATFGLVPGQGAERFAIELVVVGGVIWLVLLTTQIRDAQYPEQRRAWIATRIVSGQLATLPIIATGVSVLAHRGGGFYWLAPAVIFSFAAALIDAWVLMVEIHR